MTDYTKICFQLIERSVIASILVRPSLILECPLLPAAAFVVVDHRIVFEEACRLCVNQGDALSREEVLEVASTRLGKRENPIALLARLLENMDMHIAPETFKANVQILQREHRRRTLLAEARRFAALLGEHEEPDRAIEDHEAALRTSIGDRGWRTLEAGVDAYLARQQAQRDGKPKPGPLRIGYPSLDHIRFARGKVIVLAGRPGSGKTTLATRIAANVAASGTGVLFHAIEPTLEELVEKIGSQKGQLMQQELFDPIGPDQSKAQSDALARIAAYPLIVTEGLADLPLICAHAKRASECSLWPETKLGLVVIDYVQLIRYRRGPRERDNRRHEELSEIMRALTRMAQALDVCVLVLSAMNRAIENDNAKGRHKRLPGMADLSESGSIEREASAVLILHRLPGETATNVVVAKNRGGPCTNAELIPDFAYHDFKDPKLALRIVNGGTE